MPTTTQRLSFSSRLSPICNGIRRPSGRLSGQLSARASLIDDDGGSLAANRTIARQPFSAGRRSTWRHPGRSSCSFEMCHRPSAPKHAFVRPTAHSTPSVPRTRNTSVSRIGLRLRCIAPADRQPICRANRYRLRKLNVRLITPVKMADGQVTRNEANVSPMTIPTYLARSPSSILSAMKFMTRRICSGQMQVARRVLLKTIHFLRSRVAPRSESARLRASAIFLLDMLPSLMLVIQIIEFHHGNCPRLLLSIFKAEG